MANLPKAPASNILGQFSDDLMEAGKDVVGDTTKAVVSEPKKILESILGKASDQGQQAMEQGQTVGDDKQAQAAVKQQQNIQQLQQNDQQKSQALIRLHQQRLREEEEFFQKRQQEKVIEEQKAKQEEQEKEQDEIIQLQHENQKSRDIQQAMIGKLEGTKEAGKMQGF